MIKMYVVNAYVKKKQLTSDKEPAVTILHNKMK